MRIIKFSLLPLLLLYIYGCASGSTIVTGKIRPALNPVDVRIYVEPPSKYETIGIVEASSEVEFSSQAAMDRAMRKLKALAARIGANGLLFLDSGSKTGDSVGFYSNGIFFAGTSEIKTVKGIAIFVIQE